MALAGTLTDQAPLPSEVAVSGDCDPTVTLTATPASEPVAPEIANPAVFSAMLTVLSVAMASTLSARVPSGASSLSTTVKYAALGNVIPRLSTSALSDPLIGTTRSGLSTSLSMAAIVTTPVLAVCSAANVRYRLGLQSATMPSYRWGYSMYAPTLTASLDGWLNCAVTVLAPPFSEMLSGVRIREMTGGASSSSIVSVTPSAGSTVRSEAVVVPLTITVSSGSSMLSSSGTRSNVAVPLVAPPAIVTVTLVTAEKSAPSTAVPAATDTVTSVSSLRDSPSRVTVTVTVRSVPVASSATLVGETVSVTFASTVSTRVSCTVTVKVALAWL